MSTLFDDLEKRARTLSREEKAALARVLIDELDPVQDLGVEQLWLEEARRRSGRKWHQGPDVTSMSIAGLRARRLP